jgi:aminopeptidase N
MAARRTPQVIFQVCYYSYPRYAVDPSTVAAADAMLARTDVHPVVRRVVVDFTDDLRRALAARTLERS